MTRFIYDQFSKDYLEQLLAPYGEVTSSTKVPSEVKEIDVSFTPSPTSECSREQIGLLGRMAETRGIFEPFSSAVNLDEVCDCLVKSREVCSQLQRQAKRERTRIRRSQLPKLWILTPTASTALLSNFGGTIDRSWMAGVYFLASALRSAIVVIHRLPVIPETLWLRILGKGRVQRQAIDELEALPEDNPNRSATLKLLYNLREHLEARQEIDEGERELIMRLAPLFDEKIEQIARESEQRGIEQGIEQGIQQGIQLGEQRGIQQGEQQERRSMIQNLLRFRFGELDEELVIVAEQILALSTEELTALILQLSQLSREELLAGFSEQN